MNEQGQIHRVDLTDCDREPIHIPGGIQPFGFLLACSSDWVVTRAANTEAMIGLSPEVVIGMSLYELFLPEPRERIEERAGMLRGPDAMERIFCQHLLEDHDPFDVAIHQAGNELVVECEPARGDEMEVSARIRDFTSRLGACESEDSILREGARQLRELTGIDRVKAYRFSPDGSGEVVAEARGKGIDSFLGLHFPHTDIPVQARILYKRNIFRIIADVSDVPAPVISQRGAEPLDMSLSLFRAVSPIHIEYLRNMGVGASLSVSIIVEGRLWGLFACHHYSPILPSFAQRSGAELFGQIFSLLLESRIRNDAVAYETKARRIADRIMASAARDASLLRDADWMGDLVREAIPADGVGVSIDGNVSLSGLTPDEDGFRSIVALLAKRQSSRVFNTNSITELLPGAEAYADRASGMLAIPISRNSSDFLVLFRSEQVRSVRWAGNQEKAIEYGPNGPRLTPRKSFEEWSEMVRAEAIPFSEPELRVAQSLRTTLLEVVLRLTETASEERRQAGEQQKLLIAELNHRVRNILALIRALMGQTGRDAENVESFIQTLDGRVQSLARAHDQLTQDQWGPARLGELVATEASAYLDTKSDAVRVTGPEVLVEPAAFTVLALVIHELVTNAVKYGALSDSGHVDLDWSFDAEGGLVMEWKERGGPAVTPPTRKGFGTTIINGSIAHELGGKAETFYRTAGFEARFRIPARFVAAGTMEDKEEKKISAHDGEGLIAGKRALVVEDSSLIALDAEEKMIDLGAREVILAASNRAALNAIENEEVDIAMLDFNLGNETSVPVAEALRAAGLPFVFASGYGPDGTIPEEFAEIPLVLKPYSQQQIAEAFAKLDQAGP